MLFYYKNNKKAAWVERLQAVVIVAVTSCTVLISSIDFKYGGDCIMYCTIVLAITTLTLQSPFQAALYHFIAGIFYITFWSIYKGGFDAGYTFKFIAFIVLCFASGVAKYKLFVEKTKAQIELTNISEEFRQASLKDTLTGTKNRRALIQDSYLFCSENCFFLFTDIDHFKNVNDSYGHQNGDLVIQYYAKKLCDFFGKEHVYRFGGDEFMVVVPAMNKKASDQALHSLQTSLQDVEFDNETHSFSVSGGYLFTRLGCENLTFKIEDMLRKLDHALYEVKNNGRGYFLQA
jgi:diguanylate cyclase (GGDEF)-like protein